MGKEADAKRLPPSPLNERQIDMLLANQAKGLENDGRRFALEER